MDGFENFDVQEVVVRSRRVKEPRKRRNSNPVSWSKFLNGILYCLVCKSHPHMLWFSNGDETKFKVKMKNMKNQHWSENDISLFVELDSVTDKKRSKVKYEEDVKSRFRSNMVKMEKKEYIRKLDTEKNKEVSETILTYEILCYKNLAEVRSNISNKKSFKEVTKINKQRKCTKKSKMLTEMEIENNLGCWTEEDGSKELALTEIEIENNFVRQTKGLFDNVSQELALTEIENNFVQQTQGILDNSSQELALGGIRMENNLSRRENNFLAEVQETVKMDFSSQEFLEENGIENNFLGRYMVQEAVIKDQYWFPEYTNIDINEYATLNNMICENTNSSIAGVPDYLNLAEFSPEFLSFIEGPTLEFGECIPEKLSSIASDGDNSGLNLDLSSQDIPEPCDKWLTNFQSFEDEDLK